LFPECTRQIGSRIRTGKHTIRKTAVASCES
jgi:hypothetical protein